MSIIKLKKVSHRIKMIQLIRSKRRTISLIIKDDGGLLVRAPNGTKIDYINKFVEEKQSWILKHKKLMKEFLKKKKSHKFVTKDGVLFLGKRIKPKGLEMRNYELTQSWFKEKAKNLIEKRVKEYCEEFDLKHSGVRISNARRRWGSCGARNNLNFTWRLIMAPSKAIDYVIIHEIAHIKHKDHSKRFWRLVESMMPDYEKHDKWLEENRFLLEY